MSLITIATAAARHYAAAAAGFVEGSNYPLELMYPREVGTAPIASGNVIPFGGSDLFPAGHGSNKMYPGLSRTIAIGALGGALPYQYSLTNAPSGMTVDADTGIVTWANPIVGVYVITVTVTDAEDIAQSSPWTLTVTTTGFYFINVAAAPGGDGSIGSPFNTIAAVYAAALTDTSILYFRAGTYTAAGVDAGNIASDGGALGANNTLSSTGRPRIWLAYPGETVVYDCQYGVLGEGTNGIGVQFSEYAYVDGLRFTNVRNKLIHTFGGNYQVFKDLTLDGIIDGSVAGSNPGGIMTASHYGTYDYYCHFVGLVASNLVGEAGMLKLYSKRKYLVERCQTDGTAERGMDPKAACPRYEIRYCHFIGRDQGGAPAFPNNDRSPIFGNYDMQPGTPSHVEIDGEIRFNFIRNLNNLDSSIEVGAGSDTTYIYRNTFYGRPWSRGVQAGDPALHSYYRNVVVNPDSTLPGRVSITGLSTFNPTDSPLTTAPANVTVTDHLAGGTADNIINTTTGELQGSYLTQYGPSTATPRGCIPSLLP